MSREEIIEQYFQDSDAEVLFIDGFDNAIIGVTQRMNQPPLVTYSVDKIIEILVEFDKMTYEQAVEHFDFNIGGSWIGEKTPMFIRNNF